ncbi:MAG: FAD-dependent oxidoreductase [Flavobacteriaceae bacterium]
MHLSYWENKSWFQSVDFTIIGSGIVGLNCALSLRKKYPKSKILILERGLLPSGASTKNAGFACFGSLSEIVEDLKHHSEKEVFSLVKMRLDGLDFLRKNLGDTTIDYKEWGGNELFRHSDIQLFENCLSKQVSVNKLLKPLFKTAAFKESKNGFGFQKIIQNVFFTPFEGQIDTGKMMVALVKKAISENILILNGVEVTKFNDHKARVSIKINNNYQFETNKLLIATNGFANEILKEDIQPARAQVLITKPIKNLHLKGNFHLDKGYNYFRNIDGRILLGGGRNLDFNEEETTKLGLTNKIQTHLDELLSEIILPNQSFEIDQRWSGIMGVGSQKKPIIKQLSDNAYCGIRLGGMGVAIGSLIGKELAELTS